MKPIKIYVNDRRLEFYEVNCAIQNLTISGMAGKFAIVEFTGGLISGDIVKLEYPGLAPQVLNVEVDTNVMAINDNGVATMGAGIYNRDPWKNTSIGTKPAPQEETDTKEATLLDEDETLKVVI